MKSSRVAAFGGMVGIAILTAGAGRSAATPQPHSVGDSGTIRIHLLGHAIGSERYVIRPDAGALALSDTFAFTDRGGRVQLATTLRYGPSFEPLYLRSVGKTYRFVNVDAEVAVRGKSATIRNLGDSTTIQVPRAFFTVAG